MVGVGTLRPRSWIMAGVVGSRVRAAITRSQRITGLEPGVITELVAEIGSLWHERHQAGLASRPRRRAVGAGAKHKLVFVDRVLATLVRLRHGATHDVLACWFGVDRSTITRAPSATTRTGPARAAARSAGYSRTSPAT
ncbi:transposase family protein [Streptomyces galilaeus]|uniref:helix-turn-helix domain-containing protein n=1 Tax=Streptomyces galilaeus TaxID=33899 RepID=UPI0038F6BC0C